MPEVRAGAKQLGKAAPQKTRPSVVCVLVLVISKEVTRSESNFLAESMDNEPQVSDPFGCLGSVF